MLKEIDINYRFEIRQLRSCSYRRVGCKVDQVLSQCHLDGRTLQVKDRSSAGEVAKVCSDEPRRSNAAPETKPLTCPHCAFERNRVRILTFRNVNKNDLYSIHKKMQRNIETWVLVRWAESWLLWSVGSDMTYPLRGPYRSLAFGIRGILPYSNWREYCSPLPSLVCTKNKKSIIKKIL